MTICPPVAEPWPELSFAYGAEDLPSMRQKVAGFDWAETPLGPIADWSPELRIAVQQALDSHFPKAVVWGPALTTIYNDAFIPILGNKPEALGRSFAEIWSESWEDLAPIVDRALSGEATYRENYPMQVNRSGHLEEAWFTFCYSPLRLADGSVGGMLDTVIETSPTIRAQAELSLVNQELVHRLKNTLALVQAIATQTLRDVTDRAAVKAFEERLQALARAHDVLYKQTWDAVSLAEVINGALRAHGGPEQIGTTGPDIPIGTGMTMTLALYMHELATNALKYGALSVADGTVQVRWEVDGGRFRLYWQESGGPPVAKPDRTGFGSRLIGRGLSGQCRVERRFLREGFELDLSTPLEELER